jgi:hypothetical protein
VSPSNSHPRFYEIDAAGLEFGAEWKGLAAGRRDGTSLLHMGRDLPWEDALKIRRLFFVAVVLLALGLWLLFTYCQGTIGGQAGDHISAFSIKIDMTTVGYPAIFGVPATVLGLILLFVGAIATLVAEVRRLFVRKRSAVERPEELAADERSAPL